MDYKNFINQSFKNKETLKSSELCGCYYCCKLFSFSDIEEFVDGNKTAICPKCSIDSVVGADIKDHELFIEALKKARKEFF